MTPIGHFAISYCASKTIHKDGKIILASLLIGTIPDIDFIFIGCNWFNEFHRVATHNIFFILLVVTIIGRVLKLNPKQYVFLFIIGLIHLFIDSIMDTNSTNGIGVSCFYPIDRTSYSPFNILSNFYTDTTWDEPSAMIKNNIKLMLFEIPFIIIALTMAFKKKNFNKK